MSKNCSIMERMKSNYETRSRTFLTRRTPVIIRIDGKAFHTYTEGLVKPFDEGLISDMEATTQYLCENIQGAKLGYCQSDEISILITDYDSIKTQAWFDYQVQKITSISASMATAKFNQLRTQRYTKNNSITKVVGGCELQCQDNQHVFNKVLTLDDFNHIPLALFDSRTFNVPREEVANYFLARQKDAVKNSIAMLAQSLYSHKELEGKNGNEMQEMSWQKGVNWNDLDYRKKRGCTIMKTEKILKDKEGKPFTRGKWESIETPLTFETDFFNELI